MAGNIARMQGHLSSLGVRLRPHVKTSKCVEVARGQQKAGAVGITVSTLKEAEQFFSLRASPTCSMRFCIAPDKLDRALALIRCGCALTLLVDLVVAARGRRGEGQGSRRCLRRFDRDRFRRPSLGRAARGAGV